MIHCGDLKIGPLCFRFEHESAVALDYQDWAYADFIHPPTGPDHASDALRIMPVRLHHGALSCPDREPLFTAGRNWAVWEEPDDTYLFCAGLARHPLAYRACRVYRALQRADLYVDGDLAKEPLRYPLDQILSWGLLGQCGGVLLHAAAVEKGGEGFLFAGHSGAGKSTLSALCHEAGWSILNDDRAMVFPRAGQWIMAGTPWHGSGKYAENREVPLRSIYLLAQDQEDKVVAMPLQESRRALLNVCSVPWFEDRWSEQVLSNLEQFTASVPLRRFHFTRSSSAVHELEKLL